IDDGNDWTPCTSPASYSGLSDGKYTFGVQARDRAGNWSAAVMRTWVVDHVPSPETLIFTGPDEASRSSTATFGVGIAGLGAATFECRVDGGAWSACGESEGVVTYTELADGTHLFEVRAHNDDGGTDPTPAQRQWTIDTAPPNTILDGRSGDTFSFHATEAGAATECRIDGGDWTPCVSPQTESGLAAGSHLFEARGVD